MRSLRRDDAQITVVLPPWPCRDLEEHTPGASDTGCCDAELMKRRRVVVNGNTCAWVRAASCASDGPQHAVKAEGANTRIQGDEVQSTESSN